MGISNAPKADININENRSSFRCRGGSVCGCVLGGGGGRVGGRDGKQRNIE